MNHQGVCMVIVLTICPLLIHIYAVFSSENTLDTHNVSTSMAPVGKGMQSYLAILFTVSP